MDDDWSLKGKEKYRTVESHDGTGCPDSYGCYDGEDIETLRKKLIEDINGVIDTNGRIQSKHTIEYIINRRFGLKS